MDTIGLCWQEKSTLPMNENVGSTIREKRVVKCIGNRAQDETKMCWIPVTKTNNGRNISAKCITLKRAVARLGADGKKFAAPCFKQILTCHRNCGFHIFDEECTTGVVADMIAHQASVESKIVLSHIYNIHLNTIITFYLNDLVIVWVYEAIWSI